MEERDLEVAREVYLGLQTNYDIEPVSALCSKFTKRVVPAEEAINAIATALSKAREEGLDGALAVRPAALDRKSTGGPYSRGFRQGVKEVFDAIRALKTGGCEGASGTAKEDEAR